MRRGAGWHTLTKVLLIITFAGASNTITPASLRFTAGTGVWGYKSSFNPSLEISVALELRSRSGSKARASLYLPILIGMQPALYMPNLTLAPPGTDHSRYLWPTVLEQPQYLPIYLNELSFQTGKWRFAYTDKKPVTEQPHTVWGNPFYHPATGILNRYFQISFPNGAICTSSIYSPAMFYTYYRARPFAGKNLYLVKNLEISPSAWLDLKGGGSENPVEPAGGGAIEIDSWFYQDRFISTGFFAAINLFQLPALGEKLSYRFMGGLKSDTFLFEGQAGYIYKSSGHPLNPVLNPLYHLYRDFVLHEGTQNNHGIYLEGIIKTSPRTELRFTGEFYTGPTPTITLRSDFKIFWEENEDHFVGIGYLKEGVEKGNSLLTVREPDSFFIIDINIPLLNEKIIFEWETMAYYYIEPLTINRLLFKGLF